MVVCSELLRLCFIVEYDYECDAVSTTDRGAGPPPVQVHFMHGWVGKHRAPITKATHMWESTKRGTR